MSKPANIQRFYDHFTTDLSKVDMDAEDKALLVRYRDTYFHCLECFSLTDSQIIDYLKNTYDLSKSQAYRDLNNIKYLLKNIQNNSRQQIQYIVNQGLLQEIDDLKGDTKKHKERIMALDKLGKYNRLDKEESIEIPWGEIIPIPIMFTDDPTYLDIEYLSYDERKKEKASLYQKYAEDIEFTEKPYIEKFDERNS